MEDDLNYDAMNHILEKFREFITQIEKNSSGVKIDNYSTSKLDKKLNQIDPNIAVKGFYELYDQIKLQKTNVKICEIVLNIKNKIILKHTISYYEFRRNKNSF